CAPNSALPQCHWTHPAPDCGPCTSTSSGCVAAIHGYMRHRPPPCDWTTGITSTRPGAAGTRGTRCWLRSASTTRRLTWFCRSWALREQRFWPDQMRRPRRSSTRWPSRRMAGGYSSPLADQPCHGQRVLLAVVILGQQFYEVLVVIGGADEQ